MEAPWMITRTRHKLPAEKEQQLRKLIYLEWTNLGFRLSIVIVLFLVMGSSQTMKAAWLEGMLSLLPPVVFLIAMRLRRRPPNREFPYGYHRVPVIAFLCASLTLTGLGFYLIIESGLKLIQLETTTIGRFEFEGETYWQGWLMIAALVYSAIPPFILGIFQQSLAEKVHEKTVYADAKMSKADWMTGTAGVLGIIGVGLGLSWADLLAALVIGLDVTRDGGRQLIQAVGDLLDRRPHYPGSNQPEDIEQKLCTELLALDWIKDSRVRLREEGHAFCGEAFVVPVDNHDLARRLTEASRMLRESDWRIHEIVVTAQPSFTDLPP